MSAEALAIQSEAWAQQELQAQRALLEILRRQEAAIRRGSTDELVATTAELDTALAGTPARDARRRALGRRIAELEPGAHAARAESLTLGSLATLLARRGADVSRLSAQREELRAAVADVVRIGRRLAAIARYHGGVLEELCAALGRQDASRAGGALVDAQA